MNLPTQEQQDETDFEDQTQGHSFPMVLRSIGDFPTKAGQSAEEDMHKIFDELAQFVENPKNKTIPVLHAIFEKIEQGKEKNRANFIKVYFPHSSDSPGGFRALGEKGLGHPLTYNKVKQLELQSKTPFHKSGSPSEHIVRGNDYLELYPLVINIPIVFKEKDAILFSMLPGHAHHFIKSIALDTQDPEIFLNNNLNFHADAKLEAPKSFVLGSLTFKDTIYQEVILQAKDGFYAYKKDNQYFFSDGTNTRSITAFEHAIILRTVQKTTLPDALALRASTGGQETEELFEEVLKSPNYWSPCINAQADFIFSLEQILKGKTLQQRLEIIQAQKLNPSETQSLLFVLLDLGFDDLVIELIDKGNLDINTKNYQGVPLISHAMKKNYGKVVDYLFDHQVNLNVKDPKYYDNSPLLIATLRGNLDWVEKILKDPAIDIEQKNGRGSTALFIALANRSEDIINRLSARGALLNFALNSGYTPLGTLIQARIDQDLIKMALKLGADPNLGKPSPLVEAIKSHHLEIIKTLLDAGANPFKQDQGGLVPFVEAALRSPPEIFNLFLERSDSDVTVLDNEGISPLIAALFSGNSEKIEALQKKNPSLPQKISFGSESILRQMIKRLDVLDDEDGIKQLLKNAKSPLLEHFVYEFLIEKKPLFVYKLMDQNLINPNSENENHFTIFHFICQKAAKDFEKYSDLISLSQARKVNVNALNDYGESPLDIALREKNKKLVQALLLMVSDVSKINHPEELFIKLVEYGDLNLLQLAQIQGAKIVNGKPGTLSALQQAVLLKPFSEEIFKWLVVQGADLNFPGKEGKSPFVEIIIKKDEALIDYCLAHGAKLNFKSANAYPPMEIIVTGIKKDRKGLLLKKMVELGGDLNTSMKGPRVSAFGVMVKNVDLKNLDLIDWAVKEKGALIDPPNPDDKFTALQTAASREDDPQRLVFKKLIELGANINEEGNSSGAPAPFSSIIQTGDENLVNWCIEKGAKVDLQPFSGDSPLQAASKLPDVNLTIFKLLLKKGADINDLGATFTHPLNAIIAKGNVEDVKFCFDNGAHLTANNPNLQKKMEKSAIYAAITSGKPEMLQLLLDRGISIPLEMLKDSTTILKGYDKGGEAMLKKLLSLKFDVINFSNENKLDLWKLIIDQADIQTIKLLLDNKMSPFLSQKEPVVEILSIENGSVAILEILDQYHFLSKDIFLDIATALKIVQNEQIDLLEFLLKHGLDPNKTYGYEAITLLDFALGASKPNKQLIKLLLDFKADPRIKDKPITPFIYFAVQSKDLEIVKMILDAGGIEDISKKNPKNDQSAVDLARTFSDSAILNLLLKK